MVTWHTQRHDWWPDGWGITVFSECQKTQWLTNWRKNKRRACDTINTPAHSGGKKKHPTESQFLESASCHQWPWTVFPANVCGIPYVETRTSKSMRELHESVLSRHFTHTPMWSIMCWEQQVINCSCSAGRHYEEGAACRGRWKGLK